MSNPESALKFAHDQKERFLEELSSFLRIESISTDPERQDDMNTAAEWVAGQLDQLGFSDIQVMPTDQHPVVYGKHDKAGGLYD